MAQISWTIVARKELEEVFLFHADRSENFAIAAVDAICDAIFRLEKFPKLGRTVPEFNSPQLRELVVMQYRIVYYLRKDDVVEILRIVHSSVPLNR